MSIKQQATNSVFWSAVERFSVQGIQFLLSIVIARLLLPSDYGLIAMLSIFLAIAQTFVDSGFANALVQKKDKTDNDYSTVFYFNSAVSILFYIILYALAPYIASFYQEPQLKLVTRIIGISLIINSLGIVQQVKLTINLDFKRQAWASLIGVIFSGILGIWMAYNNWGVWALVWQSLINSFLRILFIWIFSRWLPKLIFSLNSFKTLFFFGSKLLLSSLLHTIYTNLYTLIIGKVFSSVELGYYNRAFTLAQFPSSNIASVVVRAVYPIQCKFQDNIEQLKDISLKFIRISCYIIFPLMIGLCALAEPLIRFLLTDKWLPMVPLLQILSIAFMWDPLMKINGIVLNVKGKSNYYLYAEIIKKIVAVLILIFTLPFGIKSMCIGLIIYAFVDILIIVHYSHKVIGWTLLQQISILLPIIILASSMGGIMYMITLCNNIPPLFQLLGGTVIGGIYYLGVSKFFHFPEIDLLFSILKK